MSLFLLDYFGEASDCCGICDVCRESNELEVIKVIRWLLDLDKIVQDRDHKLGWGS